MSPGSRSPPAGPLQSSLGSVSFDVLMEGSGSPPPGWSGGEEEGQEEAGLGEGVREYGGEGELEEEWGALLVGGQFLW